MRSDFTNDPGERRGSLGAPRRGKADESVAGPSNSCAMPHGRFSPRRAVERVTGEAFSNARVITGYWPETVFRLRPDPGQLFPVLACHLHPEDAIAMPRQARDTLEQALLPQERPHRESGDHRVRQRQELLPAKLERCLHRSIRRRQVNTTVNPLRDIDRYEGWTPAS